MDDKKIETRPPRRPFTFEISDDRLDDILKAYEKADEYLFKKPAPKKKKYF